jgi:hypothetical protein
MVNPTARLVNEIAVAGSAFPQLHRTQSKSLVGVIFAQRVLRAKSQLSGYVFFCAVTSAQPA